MANFQREKNGLRLDMRGINVVDPIDLLPPGKYPFLENVRRYQQGGLLGRTLESDPLYTPASGTPVHSLCRMNDTTPAGPVSGFVLIDAAGTDLYANATQVQTGLSGKRISIVPFRPNTSVQPWAYIGDDNKMVKVRSDGTCWKTGIKEPQVPGTATGSSGGSSTITYEYTYRSSATGAVSNPSPESNAVTNGSNSAQVGAGVSNYSPSQYLNYAGGPSGGTMNGEWTSQYGGFNQFRTIDSWSDSRLLQPVVTQNMSVVSGSFPIPDNVTITGIQFDLQWLNEPGSLSGTLTNCQLYYQGNLIGAQKLPGVVSQSTPVDTLVGSNGDTWGASLTPAIVNDPTFGVSFQIYQQNGNRLFIDVCYVTIYWEVQNQSVQATGSTDPQVDLIDYYRQGGALTDFTYVGTGPNGSPPPPFVDTLDDAVALVNPIINTSNYEPFPSIDLPRSGTGNASGGTLTWVSGDHFNVRWLPGTVILVGGPSGIAYVLDRRPTDTTHMYVKGLPNGTGLLWSIAEPLLAQQCMRSMWGPTDNVAFMFAVGDPLRPGTLYFTAGNDPDAAPDTNSIEVTSPSEPLMGGCIVGGVGLVGSTERFWIIYPNFFDALATVNGTVGSPFTMILSIANRGLYAKAGICSDGGANAFFVGKDGIYKSPAGRGSASITDADLYPLFPHEGSTQQDITTAGKTLYAPDFTNPDAMSLSYALGYLYFDYQDRNGNPRTLVYDDYAQGWVVDTYQHPATVHALAEGQTESPLLGCADGTIRQLLSDGTETATATIQIPPFNAGDARALKQWGDIFLDSALSSTLTADIYTSLFTTFVSTNSITTAVPGRRTPSIIDMGSGGNDNLMAVDIEAQLSWALSATPPPTVLYVWQPTLLEKPEEVKNRPTDWDDAGMPGAKYVEGFILEADTLNQLKDIQVQDSDTMTLHTPNESPFRLDGQQIKAFTFNPAFVAHSMRITSSDGVLWRPFGVKWVQVPWAEAVAQWQTDWDDAGTPGDKFIQGFVLEADTFNNNKVIQVQESNTMTLHTPNEVPFALNGRGFKAFSFSPPFIAPSMRVTSSDGVLWRFFGVKWIYQPYPELAENWQAEYSSFGLMGWQHVFMLNVPHISTADLTLTMKFDAWPDINVTIPNSGGLYKKDKVIIPANKFKLCSPQISSTQPFRLASPWMEFYVKSWGQQSPYRIILPYNNEAPIGGNASTGAAV